MKESTAKYYELLHEIQQVDFALVELNLYLNTHPMDQQAIMQFNELVQRSQMLKKNFESMYGTMRNFGESFSPTPWSWSNTPWPWQV
ncbi:MAG TPA: spore coat protein CotJB [Paenibacillaceae bacterium]|nr:spore coat protein CotJB [Paenibacillaceae bacterium]